MSAEFEKSPYHCTPYSDNCDYDECTPCKCPVCGGFLSWDKTGEIPLCNRCGAELAKFPKKPRTPEEDDDDEEDYNADGKICALTGPKYSLKGTARTSREAKEGAKKWKGWL